MTIASQILACFFCSHSWARLVGLVNGGVTDAALEPVACPRCRREVDPWTDSETPEPIGEFGRMAA